MQRLRQIEEQTQRAQKGTVITSVNDQPLMSQWRINLSQSRCDMLVCDMSFFIKFFHTCVCLFCRARGTDSQSSGVRAGEEASKGGGGAFGEGEADSRRGQSSAGSTGCRPDEEPWTAGTCNHSWTNKQFSFLIPSIKGLIDTKSAAENRQRFFVVWHGSLYIRLCFHQAAELAEFTAKIALLEDAKRKKEEEATEWQHKVRHRTSISANVYIYQRFIVIVQSFDVRLSHFKICFFPGV